MALSSAVSVTVSVTTVSVTVYQMFRLTEYQTAFYGLGIMARLARVVLPGIPYHITHRGNRRGEVFFCDADREQYLQRLRMAAQKFGLHVWGYCLMSNHIHLIAVPQREDSLAKAIGLAHARHSRHINAAHGWTGHLWASRFFSVALDDAHLWTAIRYVELNPVRARLATEAEAWPWSSAPAHALAQSDPVLTPDRPFACGARDEATGQLLPWGQWLRRGLSEDEINAIRLGTRTGRPLGSAAFIGEIETRLKRIVSAQKRGPRAKSTQEEELPLWG